ncbi:hypothetical protein F7725_018924 [Dissostichus mawsoni]|uniref:RNA-binding protein 42 n=1 Tax=Dissostichus mawsoni TaxID=36200 RepID=A0A7J5XUI2_DISMA|nr:hypothetical protein F7725_018924 [Dissostichus mawsoni]
MASSIPPPEPMKMAGDIHGNWASFRAEFEDYLLATGLSEKEKPVYYQPYMALKSGEERLKEMEAEMALFEQEVLGGPVAVSGSPPVMGEGIPVALSVPVMRAIIGTNTYSQVQQTLDARAATFVGPPPVFAGPVGQRMPMMRGPPMAPPMPRPPPPPPMMMPPSMQGPSPQGAPQPIQHMAAPPQVRDMVSMGSAPPIRQGPPPPIKPTPSIIQAAPTVYSAPPTPAAQKRIDVRAQRQARMEELAARVAEQQAAVMAAGLLDKKDREDSSTVIGPSMPEPEPPHTEPVESATEDKKRGKSEKVKKCIRTAAGTSWEDANDFRIFCGDLGNEVNDDILARAFSRYPSFLKAKVVRDKRTGKTKGYGFVSFKDPNDYVRAMREMNGKYVGSRPIKLRKSMWRDRNMETVRKKQKEKKKLGLRATQLQQGAEVTPSWLRTASVAFAKRHSSVTVSGDPNTSWNQAPPIITWKTRQPQVSQMTGGEAAQRRAAEGATNQISVCCVEGRELSRRRPREHLDSLKMESEAAGVMCCTPASLCSCTLPLCWRNSLRDSAKDCIPLRRDHWAHDSVCDL